MLERSLTVHVVLRRGSRWCFRRRGVGVVCCFRERAEDLPRYFREQSVALYIGVVVCTCVCVCVADLCTVIVIYPVFRTDHFFLLLVRDTGAVSLSTVYSRQGIPKPKSEIPRINKTKSNSVKLWRRFSGGLVLTS